MMFLADSAFGLILIALGIGFWVLVKSRSADLGSNLKGLGSFLGYFIIIVSFVVLLCTSYYTARYWEDGHFRTPAATMPMMGGMMGQMQGGMMGPMHGGMMGKMHGGMMSNPMHDEMQKNCMKMMQNMGKMDMDDDDGQDEDMPMKQMMKEHHPDK